jgi:membrane protease YdiL (CAAX protease family)
MDVRWIFLDSRGRLRSGWRFAVFSALFIVAAMMIGGIGATILQSLAYPTLDSELPVYLIINAVLMLIPALLVGWLSGKYLERVPYRALGAGFTEGWLRNLFAGILVGAATVSLAVLIALMGGGLWFESNPVDGELLVRSLSVSLAVFAIGAAWEEALFRGYILQTFARSGLAALAIALTAVFFGAIHAGNPNASVLGVTNTVLAGIWFGIAYLKTRDLWFVWGLHLMWNWMQGAVFGIEVSGMSTLASSPLLREIDSGPAWLTGGTYGVEGGIVTTVVLIVSTAVIYFLPGLKPSDEMLRLTGSQNLER